VGQSNICRVALRFRILLVCFLSALRVRINEITFYLKHNGAWSGSETLRKSLALTIYRTVGPSPICPIRPTWVLAICYMHIAKWCMCVCVCVHLYFNNSSLYSRAKWRSIGPAKCVFHLEMITHRMTSVGIDYLLEVDWLDSWNSVLLLSVSVYLPLYGQVCSQ